jgi:hypothetical protein
MGMLEKQSLPGGWEPAILASRGHSESEMQLISRKVSPVAGFADPTCELRFGDRSPSLETDSTLWRMLTPDWILFPRELPSGSTIAWAYYGDFERGIFLAFHAAPL